MLEARKKKKKISLSKVKFTDDYRWDLAFEAIKELTGVSPNAIRGLVGLLHFLRLG
jgi:hypothetical protein